MTPTQQRYLEEYEKFKHIEIVEGIYANSRGIQYEVSNIDLENETATTTSMLNRYERARTLHWCRKNLKRVG